MRPKTTSLLLAILAALSLAYWVMIEHEERAAERATEAKRVFAFAPEDFASITVVREGEKPTTGVRGADGVWSIADPYPVRANPLVWGRVAKNLAELSNERTIEETPGDVAAYGLAEPVLEVTARTRTGQEAGVRFGMMEPTQRYRYAERIGGPVFLAPTTQFFELDRDLLWLRDRELFKKGEAGITHLEYARIRAAQEPPMPGEEEAAWEESPPVVVERDAEGQWRLLEPVEALADQDMVNQLMNEIQYAVGRDYVDTPESLSDYRLDPPLARLSVKSGANGPLQTAYFGGFERSDKEQGGVFVMQEGAPAVFVVDAQAVTLFPQEPDAWHEKRLLTRKGSEIASLRYRAGEQAFALSTADGEAWKLVEPIEEAADQAAVSRFIGTLRELKGSRYYAERRPEFGLDQPAIRIALTFKEETTPAELLVGAATPDGTRFHVTQDTGAVITLSAEQVDALRATVSDFVFKGLLAFKAEQVSEVSLMFEGASFAFEKGERAWKVKQPRGKVWDSPSDMEGLLETLRQVKATSIEAATAPTDLTPLGLDRPLLAVRLTMTASKAPAPSFILGPLRIGANCPDDPHQRYAVVAGRSEVFRVPQAVIDGVREALRGVRDREPASPDPSVQ